MTKKYLYIAEDSAEVSPTSHFIMLSVSLAQGQPQRDYNFLMNHAKLHGHFFAPWTAEVDAFILKLECSLQFPVRSCMVRLSQRQLVRCFKTGMPITQLDTSCHHHTRFKMCLDSSFRMSMYLKTNS